MKRVLAFVLLCTLIVTTGCNQNEAQSITSEVISISESEQISLSQSEIFSEESSSEEIAPVSPTTSVVDENEYSENKKEEIQSEGYDYQTLYQTYSPNIKEIQFNMINITDDVKAFFDYFYLQRKENGQWIDLETLPIDPKDRIHPAIGPPMLEAHQSSRTSMRLDVRYGNHPFYKLPLQEGTYRIIDSNKQVSNPFEISSEASDQQKELITKLKSTKFLENVNFTPCDYSHPFAYQGLISDYETSGVKIFAFMIPTPKKDPFQESDFVYNSISEDGYSFQNIGMVETEVYLPDRGNKEFFYYGTPKVYSWEDKPHFFKSKNIIFLYCGEDAEVFNSLVYTFTSYNPVVDSAIPAKMSMDFDYKELERQRFFENLDPLYYGGAYVTDDKVVVLAVDKEKLLQNEIIKNYVFDHHAVLQEGDYISLFALENAQKQLWVEENSRRLKLTSGHIDEQNNCIYVYTIDISKENQKEILKTAGIEKVVIKEGGYNPLT